MARRRPADLGPERRTSTGHHPASPTATAWAVCGGAAAGAVATVVWAAEASQYSFYFAVGALGCAGIEILRRCSQPANCDRYPRRASPLGLGLLAGVSFSLAAAGMTYREHPYELNFAYKARYFVTDHAPRLPPIVRRLTFN